MLKKDPVRKVYLYIFSIVGLVLVIIGTIGIINLGLKAWVFTEADTYDRYYASPCLIDINNTETDCSVDQIDYTTSENQRDAARNLAMLIVGIPLYLFHWNRIRKEMVK